MAKKSEPVEAKFDETKYDAERQVREAFMETPLAKQQVRKVVKVLKTQKAAVKKAITSKVSSGRRRK